MVSAYILLLGHDEIGVGDFDSVTILRRKLANPHIFLMKMSSFLASNVPPGNLGKSLKVVRDPAFNPDIVSGEVNVHAAMLMRFLYDLDSVF